jgi:hypothetical protein
MKQTESKNNTLKKLLEIQLQRLEIATKFEKDKNIVFPETTQIVRDILRIEEKLHLKKTLKEEGDAGFIFDESVI